MPHSIPIDPETLRARVTALIVEVAPDIDPASIEPRVSLRDQFEFDSMDTLHLATAISAEFGIDVPESDYSQLASLDRSCAYLKQKLDGTPA